MKILLIIGTSFILLYGVLTECKVKFEDASNESEYYPLLNTRYTLSTEAYVYGVNLPPGYGDDINVYHIYPTSFGRITGPEILSEEILKPGVILEIQSINRSTISIPFEGRRIEAVVSVSAHEKEVDVPVTIDLKYLQSTNYVNKLEKIPENK